MLKNSVLIVLVLSMFGYAADPKILRQLVRNWPSGFDETGVHWKVFYVDNAVDSVLSDTCMNSYTLYSASLNAVRWSVECADFGGPPYGQNNWSLGDSLIAFGSWDSAYANNPGTYGDNANHTGFYWLFYDTISTAEDQSWMPDDTLRVLPKPVVYKAGPGGGADDTIWIEVENPAQTDDGSWHTYDVLGYWFVADSTGTGTPNAYADARAIEIDFIPVQGVFGNTTKFYMMESDSFAPWDLYDVYFAYKIVARPDTTGGSTSKIPGYSTYYFSQNSDMIQVYQNVIGIEEQKVPKAKTELRYVFPNPFVHSAKIAYALATATHVELKVYDVAGQLVRTVINEPQSAGEHVVEFDGTLLPSGVYFYQLETSEKKFAGRLVKLE